MQIYGARIAQRTESGLQAHPLILLHLLFVGLCFCPIPGPHSQLLRLAPASAEFPDSDGLAENESAFELVRSIINFLLLSGYHAAANRSVREDERPRRREQDLRLSALRFPSGVSKMESPQPNW